MSNEGYALVVGSGAACVAGLTDVEGGHHPFNPILDVKMQTLNENDDDFNYKILTINNKDRLVTFELLDAWDLIPKTIT